jgi:hypothetical protein
MTMKSRIALITFPLLTLLGGVAAHAGVTRDQNASPEYVPTGKGWGEYRAPNSHANGNARAARTVSGNGIDYHGGPVMLSNPTNVYYIWYGNWSGNSAPTILTDFANSIGGSPYYNINTTYYNGSGSHVVNSAGLAGSVLPDTPDYSQGTALSDSAVGAIVANAITSGKVPSDPNGVYFVLTSADVNETSGFCTQYCAWHTHGKLNGTDIKYGFVGNPDRCPSACSMQTTSPNGNAGADGMANLIAHELVESVSDPDLNAWYDKRGMENADKCAWTFGTTSTLSNGSKYNITLVNLLGETRNYLIQRNWVNASGGYCALSYP